MRFQKKKYVLLHILMILMILVGPVLLLISIVFDFSRFMTGDERSILVLLVTVCAGAIIWLVAQRIQELSAERTAIFELYSALESELWCYDTEFGVIHEYIVLETPDGRARISRRAGVRDQLGLTMSYNDNRIRPYTISKQMINGIRSNKRELTVEGVKAIRRLIDHGHLVEGASFPK